MLLAVVAITVAAAVILALRGVAQFSHQADVYKIRLLACWTQSFSYDGLNRLQTASRSDGGYNHTYQYDSFGNMIPQDNLHGNPPLGIDQATNRIMLGTGGYTYDAAGQQISWPALGGGSHTNWYTAEGFLRSIDSYYTGSYLYNGQGQRTLAVRDNASWTEYVYLGGQPMAEIDNTGTWTDYIYANGQKIAKVSNPGATTYYLDDHLGTTQMELDASGNVLWQGQFTPFGMELDSGATAMHYKFTGKERDAESGLDYFGARYYGSSMGRFMSPDWSARAAAVPYARLGVPQTLNLYGYVGNNPLSRVDLDGHSPDWWQKLANGLKGDGFKTNAELQPVATFHMSVSVSMSAAEASRPSNSGFQPGSLAYGVFQGSAGTWSASNRLVTNTTIGYTAFAGGAFFAPEIAAGTGAAASWTANASGALGPAAGRVFWSAVGSGAAAEWAEENGGTTLEMTPLGSLANWAQGYLPQNGVTGAAWNALSSGFASGAQGAVTYLQGAYLGNTWLNTELPILQQNGNPITTVPIP